MVVIEGKDARFLTVKNEKRLYVDYVMDGMESMEYITEAKFFGWMKNRYPVYYAKFKNFFGMPAPQKYTEAFHTGTQAEQEEARRILTEYLMTQCNLTDPRTRPDIRMHTQLMQKIFDAAKPMRNTEHVQFQASIYAQENGVYWIKDFQQEAQLLGLGQKHFYTDGVNVLYIYPPFLSAFSDSKHLQAFNNSLIGQQRAIAEAQAKGIPLPAHPREQAQPQPKPQPQQAQPPAPKRTVILDNSQAGKKQEEKKDDKLFRRIRSGNNPFR